MTPTDPASLPAPADHEPGATFDLRGQTIYGHQINFTGGLHLTRLDPANRRNQRNHEALRQAVRRFWIEGVLHSSLYNAVLIRLGLDPRPDAVDNRPWDLILQQPGQPDRPIADDKSLVEIFDDLDQQLLILGEPGAGKTTTLLALAEGLLNRTAADPTLPTPAIFNLSSWAEKQSPLDDWLVEELNTRYHIPHKVAQTWIANDELLLLLDGLDEVAVDRRDNCATAINTFRQEHVVAIAVCSRTTEYTALTTRLKLVGAVAVRALTSAQIEEYIQRAGRHVATLRHTLADSAELRDLAQTPLLLSVMILADHDQTTPEATLYTPDRTAQQHLFDRYIHRMFQHRAQPHLHSPNQTLHWLRWLAGQMQTRSQTLFLLEQLQTKWLTGNRAIIAFTLLMWFIYWVLLGLLGYAILTYLWQWNVGVRMGVVYWVICGILCGISLVSSSFDKRAKLVETLDLSWNTIRNSISAKAVVVALSITFLVGIISGKLINYSSPLSVNIRIGTYVFLSSLLMLGMIYWLNISLHKGMAGRNIDKRTIPNQGILLSVKNSIIIGNFVTASIFLLLYTVHWLSIGLTEPTHKLMLLTGLTGNIVLIILIEPRIFLALTPLLSTLAGAGVTHNYGPTHTDHHTLAEPLTKFEGFPINNPIFAGLFTSMNAIFLLGVIGYFNLSWNFLLGVGIAIGNFAFLRNGGNAVIHHFSLRNILFLSGYTPYNYACFLDYAASRLFLRKVGGGYVFVHRLLLEHFAALTDEDITRLTGVKST